VFTTHATSIGRSICGNNKPLYDYLKGYNGDQMASELNMQSKHSLEKAAAQQADCFTAVSDITAIECGQLLEKYPDVVTPNGFERNFVPTGARYDTARDEAREKMLSVARALTGRDLPADTFIVGTSGRCEYRNKGLDVFLSSMERIAAEGTKRAMLAFVMVPAWVKEPRQDLVKAMAGDTRHALDTPYLTHWINNPGQDPVDRRLSSMRQPDNVTVIYVPCYLDGRDGIFNLSYYSLLIGMDATVFPSYYEPWGYTPLESVAFGVPTVTTSLSGFGQWILSSFDNTFESCGVSVVARGDFNYDSVVGSITRSLRYLSELGATPWKAISKAAMLTARRAAWSSFIEYYERAFETAQLNRDRRIRE
jgi:glycosyltransferase involved in cell wall biosynthesis